MDLDGVKRLLAREIRKSGSAKAWCAQHNLSPGFVSEVLNDSRGPGKKLLDILGLECVVEYRKIRQTAK